jgi:hypothetical protein
MNQFEQLQSCYLSLRAPATQEQQVSVFWVPFTFSGAIHAAFGYLFMMEHLLTTQSSRSCARACHCGESHLMLLRATSRSCLSCSESHFTLLR